MKKLFLVLLVGLILSPSVMAAKKVGDATFEDKIENLVLNGAGLRKKAFIKVYASALYLKAKSSNAAEIINADQEMAVKLVITTGLVSKEKMQKAMTDGFESSTKGNTKSLQDKIDKFNNCFSDEIVKHDEFFIHYTPLKGVVVSKNGTQKGVIEGLDFKKALFAIWLGDAPVEEKLKKALLD